MLGITLQETRVYREVRAEGKAVGRQETTVNLVMRQLTKWFGKISAELGSKIAGLSLNKAEDLSEALLDFASLSDLIAWLENCE